MGKIGFADVEVEGANQKQLTIYGRLIKNTLLVRTQTYSRASALKSDGGRNRIGTVAFFALDLNNHKPMFIPETPFAPTFANFATTLQSFLRRRHVVNRKEYLTPDMAVVLDLFSRRIVGWSMGEAITAELACCALDMA